MLLWTALAVVVWLAEGDIALSRNWRQEHCIGSTVLKSMVVAVASDAQNLLPVVAVVNSTLSNAKHPEDISFVVITRHVHRLQWVIRRFLPHADVTICGGFHDLLMQRPALFKLTSLKNSTRIKRKELLSPFNFAAFYLPYVLSESRNVLYLDTDTVVKGDVAELDRIDMGGAPAGAVEDCSQPIVKYINFDMLRMYDQRDPDQQAWTRWGLVDSISNHTCVFNRGVVLFDCARWRELRLTETIEDLVDAFVASRARLWRGGISQPPFLLTLAGRYMKLDLEWNVRGLGRMDLGRKEWLAMTDYARQRYGTETSQFERHMAPSGPFRQTFNPFLCPYASRAKILHYNGEFKPWMITGADALSWRLLGLKVNPKSKQRAEGNRESIAGTCQLDACPTAVNVSSGRRLRQSACESWYRDSFGDGNHANYSQAQWDQLRYSLKYEPWDPKPETVTDYYASGCIARIPLCTCLSPLSDDCVTTCASHWHDYVNAEALHTPAAHGHPRHPSSNPMELSQEHRQTAAARRHATQPVWTEFERP